MAFLSVRRIVIDLSDRPQFPIGREADSAPATLHFVNLGPAGEPAFELRPAGGPAYRLTAAENGELRRRMAALTVSAPLEPMMAFDGPVSELLIRQHGRDAWFRWHLDPPAGWESVGALLEYAASFEERPGEGARPAADPAGD